jgi:hypothetical protein
VRPNLWCGIPARPSSLAPSPHPSERQAHARLKPLLVGAARAPVSSTSTTSSRRSHFAIASPNKQNQSAKPRPEAHVLLPHPKRPNPVALADFNSPNLSATATTNSRARCIGQSVGRYAANYCDSAATARLSTYSACSSRFASIFSPPINVERAVGRATPKVTRPP